METILPKSKSKSLDYLNIIPSDNEQASIKEDFKPKGAMAFFILLLLLCLIVWFGIYFLMLQRN